MKIQINTDQNIDGTEALAATVETELRQKLQRFEDRLTRLEVHLGDVDGAKSRGDTADKQCLVEARPEGLQPVVVTGTGNTVEQATIDAAKKMQSVLDTTFGRIADRDATSTIRQEEQT